MKKLTHPARTNRSSKTWCHIMCQVLRTRCESGIFCSLYRHKSNADKWKLRNVKLGIWIGYRLILLLTLTQKPSANLEVIIDHGTDRLDYTMQCWLIMSPCHTRDTTQTLYAQVHIVSLIWHCMSEVTLHVSFHTILQHFAAMLHGPND